MSESKGATRAVDRMLDAIRAEEPPELDWEAVERSLAVRIRRGEGASPRRASAPGVWTALSFAAAAAVLPIALSMSRPAADHTASEQTHTVDVAAIAPAPGEMAIGGAHDLTALRSGDAVEATVSAVTFADAGKVRWTLAPDSRVVVRAPVPESGVGHVVQLTRGAIRVEVRPDLQTQGFVDVLAVEVGLTRVAVHGTAFTVTLRDGEVLVDVEHGVVTVGPSGGRGATTGYQLPAGSRAAFSLDGGREARWLPGDEDTSFPTTVAAAPAGRSQRGGATDALPPDVGGDAAPVASLALVPAVPAPVIDPDTPSDLDPPPVRASKQAASPSANANPDPATQATAAEPAATAPAIDPPRPTMNAGTVQAGLQRCFQQAHPRSGTAGTKLTASSTFTLKIRADGSVDGAQFNPPLPSIQSCAAFVWSGKFMPGTTGYTLQIPVQLTQ